VDRSSHSPAEINSTTPKTRFLFDLDLLSGGLTTPNCKTLTERLPELWAALRAASGNATFHILVFGRCDPISRRDKMRKFILLTTCAAFMGAMAATPSMALGNNTQATSNPTTSKSSNPMDAQNKMTKKKKKAKKSSDSGMSSGTTSGMSSGGMSSPGASGAATNTTGGAAGMNQNKQ
jgi:uncharacterized membrane protein YgcG